MIDASKIEGHALDNLGAPLEQFDRCVCVVRYHTDAPSTDPLPSNPAALYQVTLLVANRSPSGNLIRFGGTRGDELNGWQRMRLIRVEEVLGVLRENGETVDVQARAITQSEFMDALKRKAAAA